VSASHRDAEPSAWITRFAALVPEGARMLDVAAGRGRHARFFAARGARVLAVDVDAQSLASLAGVPGVVTRVADLEDGAWPFSGESFDAIVVTNYLHRPRLPHLVDALAPDGVLLYETFAAGNGAFGRPSNPAFLLRENELFDALRERLTIVAFEQGATLEPAREAVVQRIAAVGRSRPWPPSLPASVKPAEGAPANVGSGGPRNPG
jgi:SAM-dependent methyltransferase